VPYAEDVRHTKIIATIGPASDSDETIAALIGADARVPAMVQYAIIEDHGITI